MGFTSFSPIKDYLNFVFAQEFRYKDNLQQKFPASVIEKITNCFLSPVQRPVDYILKNFYKPSFIIALNVIGVGVVTLGFYPDPCLRAVSFVSSPFFEFEPWMAKLVCYISGETIITSLMIRTLARYHNNGALLKAWKAKKIVPIHLGTVNVE